MQSNTVLTQSAGRVAGLPFPTPARAGGSSTITAAARGGATAGVASLMSLTRDVTRQQKLEKAAWLILSAVALAVLVLSVSLRA